MAHPDYELLKFEQIGGTFRIAATGENQCTLSSYTRRDFYKISLILSGGGELFYANKNIKFDQPALIFTNPMIPYSWADNADVEVSGYFCVFTEAFLFEGGRMESLKDSSLFKPGGDPVYLLSPEQTDYLKSIFMRMRDEAASEYLYKYELMRSQVQLIIHEAIKMEPAVAYAPPKNAAGRITQLFLTLLERQFPVDPPRFTLQFRKAGDYADQLAVHVNHLNAAVQEVTGKSTTAHINDRIMAEAKSLLKHTDMSVADIAYGLGFEYASYFNNFFRKHAGVTPLKARNEVKL
ncbi:helix-turn-helix domain-containing protein [Chitinophaga sp.]|uniref:helix-turn-helix domain-containing protein n=1 Tax=Chitinophaga sp. TaxID=1869181 RepID=UPI0031D6CCD4